MGDSQCCVPNTVLCVWWKGECTAFYGRRHSIVSSKTHIIGRCSEGHPDSGSRHTGSAWVAALLRLMTTTPTAVDLTYLFYGASSIQSTSFGNLPDLILAFVAGVSVSLS